MRSRPADSPSWSCPRPTACSCSRTCWAATTLDSIAVLGQRSALPVLLVLHTFRPQGLPPAHPLRAARGGRRRRLGVRAHTCRKRGASLRRRRHDMLHSDSENPFYVTELLTPDNARRAAALSANRPGRALARRRLVAASVGGAQPSRSRWIIPLGGGGAGAAAVLAVDPRYVHFRTSWRGHNAIDRACRRELPAPPPRRDPRGPAWRRKPETRRTSSPAPKRRRRRGRRVAARPGTHEQRGAGVGSEAYSHSRRLDFVEPRFWQPTLRCWRGLANPPTSSAGSRRRLFPASRRRDRGLVSLTATKDCRRRATRVMPSYHSGSWATAMLRVKGLEAIAMS